MAHLCRGQFRPSWDLLKFALSRRPIAAIVPPVPYLFRRQNGIERVIEVAAELVGWSRPSRAAARIDG